MLLSQLFEYVLYPPPRWAQRELTARGWTPTTIAGEYEHPDAPGFYVEVDDVGGKTSFLVFQGSKKIDRLSRPPYASHLNLRLRA